jgi:5-methylcytosine-specific restriction endonuclease McrA
VLLLLLLMMMMMMMIMTVCRDQQRGFSNNTKQQLWEAAPAPALCGICRQAIHTIGDAEVDHVLPWSLGGATSIANAQLVHRCVGVCRGGLA